MATVGHQDGASELVQERAVRFSVSGNQLERTGSPLGNNILYLLYFSLVFWCQIRD